MRNRRASFVHRAGKTCTPRMIVDGSDLREGVVKEKGADTQDIMDLILKADEFGDDFILEGVDCLIGANHYETMRNVWKFVKGNVQYKADKPGHEIVKSPGALFTIGFGDCKSFTLAVNSILKKLGVPRTYRFTAYDSGDFTHVYAVAKTPQGEVIIDTVHDAFDDEVKYQRKKDYSISGKPVQSEQGGFGKVLLFGVGLWVISKIFK